MNIPRKIPKNDPIPFASLLLLKNPKWPLITKHPQKWEINYEDENGKLVGTRAGRRFLADRLDGKRWHVGIDIFCYEGDEVVAIDAGKIISFYRFYTRKNGEETYAIFIEHEGVVVNYGEVRSDAQKVYKWKVGDKVVAGQKIGQVSGTDMIHFECYILGTSSNQSWMKNAARPARLLNPTAFLLDLANIAGAAPAPIPATAEPVDTTGALKALSVTLSSPLLAESSQLAAIVDGTAPALEAEKGVKRQAVGQVQKALNLLGAGIDTGTSAMNLGIFGPRTVAAIKAFQKQYGLKQTGRITDEFLVELDTALANAPAPAGAAAVDPSGASGAAAVNFSTRLPSPAAGSTVVSVVPSTTPAFTGQFKGGSATTSGSSIETTKYSDDTEVSLYRETLKASRDGKELKTADGKKSKEARQTRVKQGDQTWVEMSGYCWDVKVSGDWPKRELPVAHLVENHPGFPPGSDVQTDYATHYGKFDPIDEGTGSPAHGTVQTNSDVLVASVKKSRLVSFLGLSWAEILKRPELLWSLRVEVYYPKTKRFARIPLGDVGPGEAVPAELDLTMSLSAFLGGTGKNKMTFRLVRAE